MEMSIVVRAGDTAGAVDVMRSLGIKLTPPNRPNPGVWHAWRRIAILVEQCSEDEAPSVSLAVADLERELARLPAGVLLEKSQGTATIDVGGAALVLREAEVPVSRPAGDQQLVMQAEVIILDARAELASAFIRHGIGNPRLVGPELVLGRYERCFWLVVDNADESSLTDLNAILEGHSHPSMRIIACHSATFDAETIARIDRLAWDVVL